MNRPYNTPWQPTPSEEVAREFVNWQLEEPEPAVGVQAETSQEEEENRFVQMQLRTNALLERREAEEKEMRDREEVAIRGLLRTQREAVEGRKPVRRREPAVQSTLLTPRDAAIQGVIHKQMDAIGGRRRAKQWEPVEVVRERSPAIQGEPFTWVATETSREIAIRGHMDDKREGRQKNTARLKGAARQRDAHRQAQGDRRQPERGFESGEQVSVEQAGMQPVNIQPVNTQPIGMQQADMYRSGVHQASMQPVNIQQPSIYQTGIQQSGMQPASTQLACTQPFHIEPVYIQQPSMQQDFSSQNDLAWQGQVGNQGDIWWQY